MSKVMDSLCMVRGSYVQGHGFLVHGEGFMSSHGFIVHGQGFICPRSWIHCLCPRS